VFSGLLGAWFWITDSNSPYSATVFQCLVHTAGTLASFALFIEIGASMRAAFAAALFLAVNPLLVTRMSLILQEPTLLLLTTLAVWAAVRALRAPSIVRAAVVGISWGVCTLAKPLTWYAPFLMLAMRAAPHRARWQWTTKGVVVLLLCFVTPVLPWSIRNYVQFHRIIPVVSRGEAAIQWKVRESAPPGEPPGEEFLADLDHRGLSDGEKATACWSYVRRHLLYFATVRVAWDAIRFAGLPRDWWIVSGRISAHEHGITYWIAVAFLLLPFQVALLYRSVRSALGREPPERVFTILFYWCYWAQYALLWGDPRFAVPVYPILVSFVLA
jgi:4-amino-4-deoxy-L-arabinose transferase-like glycosyltransferase